MTTDETTTSPADPKVLQPKLDALAVATAKLMAKILTRTGPADSLPLDDILGLVEAALDCLEVAAPDIDPAIKTQLERVLGGIKLWRAYGPGGPGSPTPTYVPGPGSYRGR